jgi:hypothetical protein
MASLFNSPFPSPSSSPAGLYNLFLNIISDFIFGHSIYYSGEGYLPCNYSGPVLQLATTDNRKRVRLLCGF